MQKTYRRLISFSAIAVLVLMPLATFANPYQRLIEEMQVKIAENQQTLGELETQRDTLENRLQRLRSQISAVETQIRSTQTEIRQVERQLHATEAQLAHKQAILDRSVVELYKRGSVSTIEILAASENFSDFISRQEYLARVKISIQEATREVRALKQRLEEKQEQQQRLLLTQEAQQGQLEVRRSELRELLEITRGEEARYQQLLAENQSQLGELMERQRQFILRRQRQGQRVDVSSAYPWADKCEDADGNYFGNEKPLACGADNWGFFYRQCTSYAAWRRAQLGRELDAPWGYIYFPADAKYWKEIAEERGYKVNRIPAVGAIAVWTSGHFGHVAVVEDVNSNGTMDISQFNAAFQGEFSYMSGVSASQSDLWFIHD